MMLVGASRPETPSSKLQTPNKLQNPSPKNKLARQRLFPATREIVLPLGVWCLEFLWSLELGIWSFI
jgi:hypothetical protein